jgi:hypothetical protein
MNTPAERSLAYRRISSTDTELQVSSEILKRDEYQQKETSEAEQKFRRGFFLFARSAAMTW